MDSSWIHSALALIVCVLLSVPIDRMAEPGASLRLRPGWAWCVHFGTVLLSFTVLLAIWLRPFFAAAVSIAFFLSLVAVSNAKFRALREPFVFSDFALFSQALRFPRLYLPFLRLRETLTGGLAAVSAGYLGFMAEPAVLPNFSVGTFVALVSAGFTAGGILLVAGIRRSQNVSFDPMADLRQFGLLASLWLYRIAEAAPLSEPAVRNDRFRVQSGLRERPAVRSSDFPHLVVVQSESFFDARRLLPTVRPEILQCYDGAKTTSLSGRLVVPAWGANTMRTEFSFLSGIPAACLGVHRFNPYRRFARRVIPGLAWHLRSSGYRTICIHPHPIGFFGRDRVFPNLGFDQFIDIAGFRGAATFGPYVSDAAVGAKIVETLDAAKGPVFVFAITMENHGPLHLEKIGLEDEDALYLARPCSGFDDLTVYLRHLANADRMLGDLLQRLAAYSRESALCFFGDHVPSMPGVYQQVDYRDGRTDYLIWRRWIDAAMERHLDVSALGALLLDVAGVHRPSSFPQR